MAKEKTIKDLEAQIEMLMKMVSNNITSKDISDIDNTITFESLSLSPLYLSTEGNGKGEIYTFENFGDIQNIPLIDAREIVRHNKSFIQNGLVYIKNEDFINKENLKKYYDKIIDAESMRNLLLCKRQEFGNRFSKISTVQQETICGMLCDKLKDKKKVDEEVLFYISNYFGKNLKEEVTNLELLINDSEE